MDRDPGGPAVPLDSRAEAVRARRAASGTPPLYMLSLAEARAGSAPNEAALSATHRVPAWQRVGALASPLRDEGGHALAFAAQRLRRGFEAAP